MNKKQLYIIIAAIVVIVALIIIILRVNKLSVSPFDGDATVNYQPEFMSQEEKSAFGLSGGAQIQVLKRDEAGAVEVYKIIRKEADIVTRLEDVK